MIDIKQLRLLILAVSHDQVDNNKKIQTPSIPPVLEKYSWKKKLSYLIMGNVRSKDTCMKKIIRILRPNLDAHGEHLQNKGYIIYFAVKVFWFDDELEIFEAKVAYT